MTLSPLSVWKAFAEKLNTSTLGPADFTDSLRPFFLRLLTGANAADRRAKFAAAPVDAFAGPNGVSVLAHCSDDDYRFDFVPPDEDPARAARWRLAFLECITLPVSRLQPLPFDAFPPLPPAKETWIRRERSLSRMVALYLRLRELAGPEEARAAFQDGAGEALCARSWVPFYGPRLAFIAHAAWLQSRVEGEDAVLERFDEDACVLRLRHHLWFRLFRETAHLSAALTPEETVALFESVWRDRAAFSGWHVSFSYADGDTILTFVPAPDGGR